jgi:hypothetical protein
MEHIMRKSLALSALASLAVAGPVLASDISYTYVEGTLIGESIDDPSGDDDIEGSGLGLTGSVELSKHLFGFMNLSGTEYEYKNFDDSDFSAGRLGLGIGLHFPLGKNLDLVGAVSLQRLRLEDEFDNAINEQGHGWDIGLRGMAGQRLQWNVGLNYVDYGDDFDDTGWTAGFRYYFTRTFAAGLDVASTDKDQGQALIAFRWDIGNR